MLISIFQLSVKFSKAQKRIIEIVFILYPSRYLNLLMESVVFQTTSNHQNDLENIFSL